MAALGPRLRRALWVALAGLCVAAVALLAVVLARAYSTKPSPAPAAGVWAGKGARRLEAAFSPQERRELKEALKGAIRLQTVSFAPDDQNTTALAEFEPYIRKVFPAVFSASFIQHEVIGEYSHLFTIQGSDPQLQPYMLLAHIDVVPASPPGWDVDDPFSAEERDGFIYGRGTLDNKNSVMGILQALEFLLRRNYRPRRSFFIGLGHDEEVGGQKGAVKIAAKLEARGVQLSFLLDEGMFILDGVITGLKKPAAMLSGLCNRGLGIFFPDVSPAAVAGIFRGVTLKDSVSQCQMPATAAGETSGKKIPRPRLHSPDNLREPMNSDRESLRQYVKLIAVTEKGAVTADLSVMMAPGHSSAPPKRTSIGILSEALSRLEQQPMPNLFGKGPEIMMFEHLAPDFSFPLNIVMANLWLFAPIVSRILEQTPSTNAIVRTTTAITMFHAGVKSNVIPPSANATVNFRIHPAQTVDQVLEIVDKTIDDKRVKIDAASAFDPLPVSPWDNETFGPQVFRQTILDVFPDVGSVAPGICIGNTDSRHFNNLTNAIYRFNPVVFKPDDMPRFHGLNERISVESFEKQVEFLFQLIQNSDIDLSPEPHVNFHEL